MATFKYRAMIAPALDGYKENGMEVTFNEEAFNGLLVIEADDEATADKIRMTYTDIRMWEKVPSTSI